MRLTIFGLLCVLACGDDDVSDQSDVGVDAGSVDSGRTDAGDASQRIADAAADISLADVFDAGPDVAFVPDAVSCEPWSSRQDPLDETYCEGTVTMDSAPFGNRVALTFDDGPSIRTTPAILATLREQNVPATFFVLGWRINEETAPLLREMYEDPLFTVANHGWTHMAAGDLGPEAFDDEIRETNDAIRTALGDPCYFPRYFRFPFGRATCDVTPVVESYGLAISGVDVDPVDWCFGGGGGVCPESLDDSVPDDQRDDLVAFAMDQLEITGGGIMLLHDIQPNTMRRLPGLLQEMRDAGYTFVTLEDFPNLQASVRPSEPPACCGGIVR